LSEAKALLFSSGDCEANLTLAGRLAVPALADGCVVHLRDGRGVTRMLAAFHTEEAGRSALLGLHRGPSEEGPWDVFRTGQPELLSDAGTHYLARMSDPEERRLLEQLDLGSVASAPMVFQERPFGAISLFTSRYRKRLTERDLALVQDLSQCGAAAVAYTRSTQELQKLARVNDELLTAFAHNLRNPLGSAHIWLALLRSEPLGQASSRAVSMIDRSLGMVTQVLSQMVDVSRMITGRAKLEKQNTDLLEILDMVLKEAEPAAGEKQLRLETDIDRSLELLWADPRRVRQALESLISNAIKFTPTGGEVRVRLERSEGWVRIGVRDSGIGIPAQALGELFLGLEARSVTTGLGLAIARRVAELHYGNLRAESDGEGRGSLFTLEFPLDSPLGETPLRSLR
jgi:signal transduction histidine kinase